LFSKINEDSLVIKNSRKNKTLVKKESIIIENKSAIVFSSIFKITSARKDRSKEKALVINFNEKGTNLK